MEDENFPELDRTGFQVIAVGKKQDFMYTLANIHTIFSESGLLAKTLPSYEFRQGQVEMCEAVADVFRHHHHLIVEAGTGTGKTLAYLIPAMLSGVKTIVSTGTKNLQEQLFYKDVPFLRKHVNRDVAVVYMKGRANYVCLKRFKLAHQQQALFQDAAEVEIFRHIEKWVRTTKTGDRAELQGVPENYGPWREVCCTRDTCPGRQCELYSKCFLMKMRQEADEADIIIVNHHLFFADLSIKGLGLGTVIPEYEAAIFDEAHLLESIATSYFSVNVNSYQSDEIIQDTTRELKTANIGAKDFTTAFHSLQKEADRFFQCFANKGGRYRLSEHTIDKKMLEVAPDLANALLMVVSKLKGLKDIPKEIQFLIERIEKMQSSLEFIVNMAEPGFVYWCETIGRGIFLHASPIDVADDMRRNVFEQLPRVVLTSATLATGKNFQFAEERLGLDRPIELIVESPFDHQKQAILYLPKGMPDPNSKFFIREAADEIERILKKSKGRAFVLFTSYKNMNEAHKRLKDRLGFKILKQGTGSRTALLNEFRKDIHSVLFATSSFWQGVDVQGEALSCVIIDKLPFAVPSDPIVEARIEYLRNRSENPFMAYQVPSAIITLKQGLGRLIRSKQDKGMLSILDNRLTTKKYGEVFLESLPKCRIVRELDDITL